MAFKPPKKQPDFSVLKKTLAQTKNHLDNATYQTIQGIIDKLTHLQTVDQEEKTEIKEKIVSAGGSTTTIIEGFTGSSYLTTNDETANLPNSRRLLAGDGIIFDDSVAGIRTISSTSVGGAVADHIPMVTGAEPLEFMSDGAGNLLLIEYSDE